MIEQFVQEMKNVNLSDGTKISLESNLKVKLIPSVLNVNV